MSQQWPQEHLNLERVKQIETAKAWGKKKKKDIKHKVENGVVLYMKVLKSTLTGDTAVNAPANATGQ